jgi:hypothetical protein
MATRRGGVGIGSNFTNMSYVQPNSPLEVHIFFDELMNGDEHF